ncbi:MAG: hypothetical protein HS102_11545 [Planctomycetia bacterium]|nr:hypothetical protein [Planctomycetia bacterium]MCQ3921299.1 hypothetical protein [Planctomycetota bacterium]
MSVLTRLFGMFSPLSLFSVAALGQSYAVIGPARQVNPSGSTWRECSVAARFGNPQEVVAAANDIPSGRTAYGVTLNGGLSFVNGQIPSFGLDPWVAADPVTDAIWITALGTGQQPCQGGCVAVAWKAPGATTFNLGCTVFDTGASPLGLPDKPAIGIGPNGQHHVALLASRYQGGPDHAMWSSRGNPPGICPWVTDRVQPFDNHSGPEWEGWGSIPVILSTGRIVVVTRDEKKSGQQYQWEYNGGLPHVAYADAPNPDLDWKPDDEVPILVAEGAAIQPTQIQVGDSGNFRGDSPYAIDRRQCAPAIAVDPDNDDIYVAFYARHVPGSFQDNLNTDIYISRGFDTGGSLVFPGLPGDPNLLHLIDELLTGQPGGVKGPDQVMPSIVVDACGGVNLVFYDNRHDPDLADDVHWMDLYYVRITGYGTPQQAIQQERLTPASFRLNDLPGLFLGDYHNMVAASPGMTSPTPLVYPAYIALAQDEQGNWTRQNCYLRKITIYCSGDLNLNGELDDEDVRLFDAAFAEKRCEADLTGDDVVDNADEKLFREIRARGCNSRGR